MEQKLKGNAKSVFTCNGASNHSMGERQFNDYYATEPKAVKLLLEKESFSKIVWECACGEGHISDVLKEHGYIVYNSDIIDRGYSGTVVKDFLKENSLNTMDIVTNPPYKIAKNFVEHALDISADGVKIAMFLKLTFLESKTRKKLFEKYPFRTLYVSSSRLQCAKNGDFEKYKNGTGTAVAYGWYVWEKGFNGKPTIEWI
nr:MAG TPA: adenine-specific methyltransferase [Caudoviricetes sp.]